MLGKWRCSLGGLQYFGIYAYLYSEKVLRAYAVESRCVHALKDRMSAEFPSFYWFVISVFEKGPIKKGKH